jgi:hypothetical protein
MLTGNLKNELEIESFENRTQVCQEIEWFRYLNVLLLDNHCIIKIYVQRIHE